MGRSDDQAKRDAERIAGWSRRVREVTDRMDKEDAKNWREAAEREARAKERRAEEGRRKAQETRRAKREGRA